MSEKGKVSVVVPIYKPRRDWLEKCLESVEEQTYGNIELIVIDDSPDDNYRELLEEIIDREFQFINNEENQGIPKTRNIGVEASSGEYVTILDQDDYIDERKIKKQVECFKQNEELGMCLTSMYIIDSDGCKQDTDEEDVVSLENIDIVGKYLDSLDNKADLSLSLTTEMVRKNVYDDVGTYDEDIPQRNDLDLLLRVNEKYSVKKLYEKMFFKRIHGDNISRNSRNEMINDNIRILEKLERKNLIPKRRYRNILCYLKLKLTYSNLKSGNLIPATGELINSIKISPFRIPYLTLDWINRKN